MAFLLCHILKEPIGVSFPLYENTGSVCLGLKTLSNLNDFGGHTIQFYDI